VQRSAKFVRYLREFGYEPIVVTGPGAAADQRWTPRDDSLTDDVLPATDVRRLPTMPSGSVGARRRLERWTPLRSPFERWWVEGLVETGRDAGRGVDVVYASMSPFETAEAAAQLSRALGVPWVADLRDPWALDEMTIFPTVAHRFAEERRMRRALSSAAAIVMNTREAARAVVETFPELSTRLAEPIPNGYDAADFAGATAARASSRFRIVHTGYLHTEHGLRHREANPLRRALERTTPGVDFLTRSHVYLLQGLAALLARRPELQSRMEVVLAGVLSPADDNVVQQFAHRELVRTPGYVPHRATVELIRTADLLFLPMHDLPAGRRSRIVPGKTYEYLASGRPILAAVPDGDARDLLGAFGQVTLCRPADASAIAAAIDAALVAGRNDRASAVPAGAERFERRQQTRTLAQTFDSVVSASRSVD
jgi:glycosyltransferase involved in cell wall biosynthesis